MSNTNTPTVHNAAKYGEIAPAVLMCGDPLRVKKIAETYLTDPVMYSSVRGMYGFTGLWKGKRVSVQGHGMGCPSMGIYSYELFKFYDVEKIIRLGTCGAYKAETALGTLIMASTTFTDSKYGYQYGEEFAGAGASADGGLLTEAAGLAVALGVPFISGKVFSSDVFYDPMGTQKKMLSPDVLAVEMELHALYTNASALGRKALGFLTVTDNIPTGAKLSAEEREAGYGKAIELALDVLTLE